ncbi:nuclear transport factor 2 family protein [Rhodococcus sp. T2V]|uniref:nuclear transport factor 2 family protein n=1 Tax=Rhodococcus sp. T2V TaxID=3034164 RepID=UPI0023E11882|nr:nuclear transport factor 2 family protein [Rhodococcus sp. T2V]MDF3312207.1 nuclear transport factor 2 family protein [Rhodococcus sp. T2V]
MSVSATPVRSDLQILPLDARVVLYVTTLAFKPFKEVLEEDVMVANDIEGVRRTLAAYCQLMDDGDYGEAANLFHSDARWTVAGVVYNGITEIRNLVASWPVPDGIKHLTFNSIIDVDGGLATAVSDYLVMKATDIGGVAIRAGRYHDSLSRSASGEWKFSERENRGSSFVRS